MDILEFFTFMLVFYAAVLVPVGWVLWEYAMPKAKIFFQGWNASRIERRIQRKKAAYDRWKESRKWQ